MKESTLWKNAVTYLIHVGPGWLLVRSPSLNACGLRFLFFSVVHIQYPIACKDERNPLRQHLKLRKTLKAARCINLSMFCRLDCSTAWRVLELFFRTDDEVSRLWGSSEKHTASWLAGTHLYLIVNEKYVSLLHQLKRLVAFYDHQFLTEGRSCKPCEKRNLSSDHVFTWLELDDVQTLWTVSSDSLHHLCWSQDISGTTFVELVIRVF